MNEENKLTNESEAPPAAAHKTPSLLRNYISFAGIAIVAATLVSIAMMVLLELSGTADNPYTDLITYIFLPSVMGFGFFLMIVGALWERRKRRTMSPEEIGRYPVLDLNDPTRRRSLLVFMGLAFIFLFMTAFGSYRAFEYTESVTFCGQACHSVMKPEFVAYQASPHSQIRCVECHVGGGAEAYVKAKFNGMNQLKGVITGHFNRPILTPVHNMREATQTCQKCHWAEKYNGEELRVFNHYAWDEKNSLNQTRMLIKVGGGNPDLGPVGGIHWHMNVANEITFVSSDDRRQTIPWVRMKNMKGEVVEYRATNATMSQDEIARAPQRKMDCIDCHNRPTHIYLSPNEALDRSFDAGKLDISLPFLKATAAQTLAKPYNTNEEAVSSIAADINNFYSSNYPDIYRAKSDSVNATIAEVQRIYQTYFFPEMKTDFRAHANNIGHYNAQGCFRCHDNQHVSPEGKVIRNDCSICHTTLDQTFAGKTIRPENGMFQHPVNLGDKNTYQCAACHKGDTTFKHPLNLGDISQFQCAECHKGSTYKMNLNAL